MKKQITIFLAFLAIVISKTNFAQTTDPYSSRVEEIKKSHKEKDKVVEAIIYFEADSTTAMGSFYLSKGKYEIFVIPDSASVKTIDFSLIWDSMEGDAKEKSQRHHEYVGGKGILAKEHYFVTNPTTVAGTAYGSFEFKINNIMNMVNNSNRKQTAVWANQATGMKQTWTKTKNGAVSFIKITVAKENKILSSGAVKILVYER